MNLNGREISTLRDLEQAVRDGVPGAAELAEIYGARPAGWVDPPYSPTSFPTPATDAEIESKFGMRTLNGRTRMHEGVDVTQPEPGAIGGEPAVAVGPGEVVFAGKNGGYGNQVRVEHPDGTVSSYSHLDSINVQKGQQVEPGWSLGAIGTTGHSEGNHLHFELHAPDGSKINTNAPIASLQALSGIAAGNTTANAVGQYGPETAVLGPSIQAPFASPLPPITSIPVAQTAIPPLTPGPLIDRPPQALQVGNPALAAITSLQPAGISKNPALAPSTAPLSYAPPASGTLTPAVPVSRSIPATPVTAPLPAAQPATNPIAVGQPLESFGPPAPMPASAFTPGTEAPADPSWRTNQALFNAPPETAYPAEFQQAAMQRAIQEAALSRPASPPDPVLGGLSIDPLSRPFSLSPAPAGAPNQAISPIMDLPRAASPSLPIAKPAVSPPAVGLPVQEVLKQGPPPPSTGPTAFLTSPEANPAYAPSIPAPSPDPAVTAAPVWDDLPSAAPTFQSAWGPEQALRTGITMGPTPWDPAPSTYNPPDLIAGPAVPATPTPGQIVDAYPDDFFHTPVNGVAKTPTPPATIPTVTPPNSGVNVGGSLPVVQPPKQTPPTPDSVSTTPIQIGVPARTVVPTGPKPNVGLRAPIGTQDVIGGVIGGVLGGPVGAVMGAVVPRTVGSLFNAMGNPMQRMMQSREQQRLDAEAHGISVGVGFGNGYGGSTSGMGGSFLGGGGAYERDFGITAGAGSWADKANYGR